MCDVYGNCTEESSTSAAAGLWPVPNLVTAGLEASRVVVTSPSEGDHVNGEFRVAFDVDAVNSIELVDILIDGGVVSTRSFADGERSVYEASIAVPGVAEGLREVSVRAQMYGGEVVESLPVQFVYDVTAPVVTIDDTDLTEADSWGPGTNMYRLSGTVADDGTVVAVQVRIGADGPWLEAMFDAGQWSIATQILDADGASLDISVRAFDVAGNEGGIAAAGSVNLSPEPGFERVDTVIDSCDGCVEHRVSATFEFSGVAGSNEVASFECRLDGLPSQICNSPWVLDDLAVGSHELAVTAVDAGGFVDLTPATFEWTVNASGPQPTMISAPSDPSFDRSARFVFSGAAGASFECSLDGVGFEPCESPYVVDQLGYGAHEFRVRVSVGGETGTALAHRWTLRNAAPVALDQVVLTVVDTPREVVVDADDSDDLSYLIEVDPLNGTLEGTPPNLVYVPFDGFIGFDSFSFVANDGQATSAPGEVGIYVGTATVPSVTLTR